MVPGEGMMVGNFARALFLVHSECAESTYINSRPFRVNAGPVTPLPAALPDARHKRSLVRLSAAEAHAASSMTF